MHIPLFPFSSQFLSRVIISSDDEAGLCLCSSPLFFPFLHAATIPKPYSCWPTSPSLIPCPISTLLPYPSSLSFLPDLISFLRLYLSYLSVLPNPALIPVFIPISPPHPSFHPSSLLSPLPLTLTPHLHHSLPHSFFPCLTDSVATWLYLIWGLCLTPGRLGSKVPVPLQ